MSLSTMPGGGFNAVSTRRAPDHGKAAFADDLIRKASYEVTE